MLKTVMKRLSPILLILLLIGCASSSYIKEDDLVKTRIYVGNFTRSVTVDEKYSYVYTTQAAFRVKGHPEIVEGTWCYIRIERCMQDVTRSIAKKLEVWYFTWNGTDKEYKIKR